MHYIKHEKADRFNLLDNGVDIGNGDMLKLSIHSDKHDFKEIKDFFSSIEDEIVVYGCIVQDDGRETDEFVSTVIPNFTELKSIEYNSIEEAYIVSLISPDNTDLRLRNLEKMLERKTKGPSLESRVTALEEAITSINKFLNTPINSK